jgi:hypothetical protein
MRKEKFRRYKYFNPPTIINWGKFQAAHILSGNSDSRLSIVRNHADHWEINIPVVEESTSEIEYQALGGLTGGTWGRFICYDIFRFHSDVHYPFHNFRDALMAAKELRTMYVDLPISVMADDDQEEPVIIGRSDSEEVAAILTYS